MDFGGADDILFEIRGRAGIVTLNRPSALNAVNERMVAALSRALNAWRSNDAVAHIVLKAEGRAFSAGGDILDVYEAGRAGQPKPGFFADEYRLNASIARYEKPYVSLIDGIVMGGGVGISGHGSHRVMSEKAVYAMPEVGIGFFPDVGGSHILSRLPGEFGMYLALTGNRIRWGDAAAVGLATHAVRSERLPELLEALCEAGNVDTALAGFAEDIPRETDDARMHAIARHFSYDALDDIVAALRDSGDEWLHSVHDTILSRSPTSLRVAFRQVRAGAAMTMDECMRMEYRILRRMLEGHEFYEGIRAALIDRTTPPQWRPARLEDVSQDDADVYFAPLEEGDLVL